MERRRRLDQPVAHQDVLARVRTVKRQVRDFGRVERGAVGIARRPGGLAHGRGTGSGLGERAGGVRAPLRRRRVAAQWAERDRGEDADSHHPRQ